MLRSYPFQPRKFVPFGEGSLKADGDKKRFNIRDQNAILKEFLAEHKDAVGELVDGDVENISPVTRIFLSGRVRIEVPIIPEEIVPDMTCEECEKDDAVAKCEVCDEVFCDKCLELCHEKNWLSNILHAHYISNSIRELQVGDKSRVNLHRPYVLPEYECYDTDKDLIENKNISVPYSLAVPTTLRHRKMTAPLLKPKYNVGDTILFLDFQSLTPDNPVFGIIVSEWDFRHGDAAPTITRGQDSVMWYVIRRLDENLYYDPYEEGGDVGEFTAIEEHSDRKHAEADDDLISTTSSIGTETSALTGNSVTKKGWNGSKNTDSKPLIEGVEDVPLRKAMAMAKEINKRSTLAKQIRTFGSKLHFSSLFTAKANAPSIQSVDDDEISVLSRGSSLNDTTMNGSKLTKHQWHMLQALPEAEAANVQIDDESMAMMSDVLDNNTGPMRLRDVSDTYVVVAGLEAKGVNTLTENGVLLPASKRSYYHVYEDTEARFTALDRSGSWDWGSVSKAEDCSQNSLLARDMLKILVMPENEIHEPKDYFKKLLGQKQLKFKGIVKKAFVKIFAAHLQKAFEAWVCLMHDQIFLEETAASIVIQAAARRWLCRNFIRDIRDDIQMELENRRATLHSSMRYSTIAPGQSTKYGRKPLLFTLDNRRYFDTRRDVNRYALHLRVEISKVVYFLNIRRCAILKQAIEKWRELLHAVFLESDLKVGHVLPFADNEYAVNRNHGFDEMRNRWREEIAAEMTMDEYRTGVKRIHSQLKAAFLDDRNEELKLLKNIESNYKCSTDSNAIIKYQMPEKQLLGRGGTDTHLNILAVPLGIPKPGVEFEEESEEMHSPFHPTIALRVKPNDLTTGCAGGYSTTRKGDLFFSNDDYGLSSASKQTNCITIDTSFATKTAYGSVSRIGKDGVVNRINPNDNKLVNAPTFEPNKIGLAKGKNNRAAVALKPKGSHFLSVLPPLPVIPVSQDQDGNLAFTSENKPKYNSLRSRLEGPTEYSCWIIPGLLAMGNVPVGRAWRRRQVKTSVHTRVDAVSQLVLSGISTFVSLLTPENEAIAEKRCPISLELGPERGGMGINVDSTEPGRSIELYYKEAASKSRFELKNVISDLKSQIENWNAEIQLNIVDDPKDMRYEASLKEDLRLRARRAITVGYSDTAKRELLNLPDIDCVRSEFVRMPIEQDSAPPLNDILPLLWELERRMMSGERLYIYSLEGHGRSGMICGCLLGRLYGLTPRETLFRMQVYHDCIASHVRRLVPINCPQLINQQELLSLVLKNTNRVFDGVMLRSQLDPETYMSELHHLERGSQVGVYGVTVSEFVEMRTVPTVYHTAGGKSKITWTDNGKKSFDDVVDEPITDMHACPVAISRRTTHSSGGYSKQGLSLRNSRSNEEDAQVRSGPGSPTYSETKPHFAYIKGDGQRTKFKNKGKSKRRATTGAGSSDSESDREESIGQQKNLVTAQAKDHSSHVQVLPSTITEAKIAVAPNKIKSLRPAPADAPKLPSIRSRYGDIA